jgi:hypothetical protein
VAASYVLAALGCHGLVGRQPGKDPATPLTVKDVEAVCSAVAQLADARNLATLAVPGKSIEDGLTNAERATLTSDSGQSVMGVYELQLVAHGPPARFVQISSAGTCPAEELWPFDNPRTAADAYGVTDPNDDLRWAHWGTTWYPIVYRGRYFLIIAKLGEPNRVEWVWWIKPDGRYRPLCTLRVQSTSRVVRSAKEPALCTAVAEGTLSPMPWTWLTDADLPTRYPEWTPHDSFILMDGARADLTEILKADLDGDGTAEFLGHDDHASGAGCGDFKRWLFVVSAMEDTVAQTPVNDLLLRGVAGGALAIYEYQGRHFLDGSREPDSEGPLQVRDGHLEELCEFERRPHTGITRFVDIEVFQDFPRK